ncbi:PTS sugar transporter subunit IIA [Spirochaeta cellobiosiphila]|uniref:PTS sugar transporter subunit IIA n=1 Tax=Spirochaeta cellobiosiphila TaxID=504483 RepID=UPI000415A33F|nr:PTS sugar transporter subunit IIA [Spirochaeta cellobiosiphila]
MEFLNHVKENYVVQLKGTNKASVISELASLALSNNLIKNLDDLVQQLNYREELMSTGIGLGLGIPHVRYADLKEPAIFIGIQPEGIADYESLDQSVVKIVFMILVREGEHKRHVRLLSQIVSLLKSEELRNKLLNSSTPSEALTLLREANNA